MTMCVVARFVVEVAICVRNGIGNQVANRVAMVSAGFATGREWRRLECRIFRKSSGDEKLVFGLDQPFLDAQVVVRGDSVARKKAAYALRNVIRVEKRRRIFPPEPGMQFEIGAARFDEQLASRIPDEEGHMQSFLRNLFPTVLFAVMLLPHGGVVE